MKYRVIQDFADPFFPTRTYTAGTIIETDEGTGNSWKNSNLVQDCEQELPSRRDPAGYNGCQPNAPDSLAHKKQSRRPTSPV